MEVTVRTDFAQVPENSPFVVRLMVSARAEAPREGARRPLNLAVALDRSGSMDGDKLENVKEATRILAARLGAGDHFSLATFDDVVDSVVTPRSMGGGIGPVEAAISGIRSGGCTNLSDGYRLAGDFAKANAAPGTITRVMLLTDGQANRGEVQPDRLGRMAAGMLGGGVSTTTIGVGSDYNEELLGRLAEMGGGGTYFIESPDEAHAVFEQELGLLANLVANGFRVCFRPSIGGIKAKQLNSYPETGGGYEVGDVFGGHPRRIVLEVFGKGLPLGGPVEIGRIEAVLSVATDEGFEERRFDLPVRLEAIPDADFNDSRRDREVSLEAAFLLVARAKIDALAMADRGKYKEAAVLLEECARSIERLRLDDATLDERLRDLRERAARLGNEGAAFYSAGARKRLFTESQMASKSYQMKEEAMYLRRRAREAGEPGRGNGGT